MGETPPQLVNPTASLYMDPKLPEFLRLFDIDLVFDVGANVGQFAQELIAAGYAGRIVSFEPLTEAHAELERSSQDHGPWVAAERCALGAETGEAIINIAGNLQSSSLLPMLDGHVQAAPRSRYVGAEAVPVRTLDDTGAEHAASARAPFLKIDVQGFEDRVLQGATRLLPKIRGVQVEMSLVPLYDGEPGFEWLLSRLRALGFDLWWIRPGFIDDSTGRALQVDGVFFRSSGNATL